MKKTITIEIDNDGSASIDLANFKGKGCDKVSADFAAGAKVTLARNKPEYLQVEQQKTVVKQ